MHFKMINWLLIILNIILEVSCYRFYLYSIDALSYSVLEKLITDGDNKKDEKRNVNNQYL